MLDFYRKNHIFQNLREVEWRRWRAREWVPPWLHLLLPPLLWESLLHSWHRLGDFETTCSWKTLEGWGCDLLSSFSSSWLFKRMSSVTWKKGGSGNGPNILSLGKISSFGVADCNSKGADVMNVQRFHHLQEPIFPTLSLRSDTVRKRNWSMGLTESPRHWVLVTKAARPSGFPTYFSEHCEWISRCYKSVSNHILSYYVICGCLTM